MKRKHDSISRGSSEPPYQACRSCGFEALSTTPGTPKSWPWATYEAMKRLHALRDPSIPHSRSFSLKDEILPYIEQNWATLSTRKSRPAQVRKNTLGALRKYRHLFALEKEDYWTLCPISQASGSGNADPPPPRLSKTTLSEENLLDEESSIDLLADWEDDDMDIPLDIPECLRDDEISNVSDSNIEIPDMMDEDDDLDLLADSSVFSDESDEPLPESRSKKRRLDDSPPMTLTSSTTIKEEPPSNLTPKSPFRPKSSHPKREDSVSTPVKRATSNWHLLPSPKIPDGDPVVPYVPISQRRRVPRDLYDYGIEEVSYEADDEADTDDPILLIKQEDLEDEDDGLDDDEVFVEVIPKFIWDSIANHPFLYKDRSKKYAGSEPALSKSEETEKEKAPLTPSKFRHHSLSSVEEDDEMEEDEDSLDFEIDILGEGSSDSDMDMAPLSHLIILTPKTERKSKPKIKHLPSPTHDDRQHDSPSLGMLLQSAVEIPVYSLVADYDLPISALLTKKKSPSARANTFADSSSEDELTDADYLKLHRKAEQREKADIRSLMRARRR